jgi:hypothetical protein
MSLLQNNNSYGVAGINSVESVTYDGEEMSLTDAFNELLQPQYDLIEETGGMQSRQEIHDYETYGDDFIDQKKTEMDRNWEKEFSVVLDTRDGHREFRLERNNSQPPEVQEHPYSTAVLKSDQGEKLGFRLMRDHHSDDIHERDFLRTVDRPGGVDDHLRELGINPVGRGNFVIAEDNPGSSGYHGADAETAVFYNYADPLASRLDEKAQEFGEYLGTMSELGFGRTDRDPEEFMVAEDGHVYETDHEKLTRTDTGFSRNDVINLVTNMANESDVVNDPREVQSEVMEGYEPVVEQDYDLRKIADEALTEFDLDSFRDERLL